MLEEHFKDEVLDSLAAQANVAQFVSFGPGPQPPLRFSRMLGEEPNRPFASMRDAIERLLWLSNTGSVNIRSYLPESPKSNEFVYGLQSIDEALSSLARLAGEGMYTIVNETIDINDGGVSGVIVDEVLEFAPKDTPRAVEKPGIAAFPCELGLRVLKTVYGFAPSRPPRGTRLEFSLHPVRVGSRQEHVVLWEAQLAKGLTSAPLPVWPNNFSRAIGDKAFGLLVAHAYGTLVPETLVISRAVPPFRFGTSTGTNEPWIRTAPLEPVPGRFTTQRGWTDPFQLLISDDPGGQHLAGVLVQEGVAARFSGGSMTTREDDVVVEGVEGFGESFMQGADPSSLPDAIVAGVRDVHRRLASVLGPVRTEWVADGEAVWVVQLHRGASQSSGRVIVPGATERERQFDIGLGLEALRSLVEEVAETGEGVVLVGDAGITSHFGDVLRKANVPSRFAS